MNKRAGPVKSLLSILLTVSILFGITPLSAVSVPVVPETENTRQSPTEEFKAPDIIDAEEQAEKSYVGRVKEDEKDLYTFVFRNEDGSNTMRVFDHPVKYVDDKGETRDISLDIAKEKDGSFKAADHMIKASFGDDISEGIGLGYDGVRIKMTAKTVSGEKESVGLSSDGKKLTYAVDGKTSYVYSLTYCGIKEDIVVSEYTGQTEYEFTLNTNGLHPVKIDGSVFLADEEGEIRASIGDIIIFTADNRNNAFGDLQFEAVEENSEYKFTIVLDPDYLRDEKTAYPITIDPTIEINYAGNGAGAIEDVTINSLDTSAGSSGSLYVGRRNTYGLSRILMRFPTLNLSGIASSNDLISATVQMKDLLCESESMYVECYIFNGGSWSESNVGWNTVTPYTLTTLLSNVEVKYSIGNSLNPLHRYSFSILNAVKGWKDGTADQSKGIIFKAPDSIETGNIYINKTFASYNRAANQPSLKIVYKTRISLNCLEMSVVEGGVFTLTATTSPSGQSVLWFSSNPSVATVNSSGVVTGINAGKSLITAMHSNEDGSISYESCNVYVYIKNGVYYIGNPETDKYMDLDYPSEDDGTLIEQWEYCSAISERWTVLYLGSGYYAIRSTESKKYASVSGGASLSAAEIVQTSSVSDASKWRIAKTSSGYYKISPKCAESNTDELVLAVPQSEDYNGLNLELGIYSNNTNYKDEWFFESDLAENNTRMPNYDGQNKNNWCWAASSKKVGEHNGGSGALISGASRLDNTEGIHSYNGTQFYGETLEWTITADAGQRSIVCAIKGSDIDAAGSLYDIVSAIKLSVSRSKNIGVWYIGSAITESELNNLNNELNNGRWVVACFSFGYSGHVIVIKDYDSATTCYTIWDPWDDSTKLITKYQLCNNMIQLSESGITYTLDAVVYCR